MCLCQAERPVRLRQAGLHLAGETPCSSNTHSAARCPSEDSLSRCGRLGCHSAPPLTPGARAGPSTRGWRRPVESCTTAESGLTSMTRTAPARAAGSSTRSLGLCKARVRPCSSSPMEAAGCIPIAHSACSRYALECCTSQCNGQNPPCSQYSFRVANGEMQITHRACPRYTLEYYVSEGSLMQV